MRQPPFDMPFDVVLWYIANPRLRKVCSKGYQRYEDDANVYSTDIRKQLTRRGVPTFVLSHWENIPLIADRGFISWLNSLGDADDEVE